MATLDLPLQLRRGEISSATAASNRLDGLHPFLPRDAAELRLDRIADHACNGGMAASGLTFEPPPLLLADEDLQALRVHAHKIHISSAGGCGCLKDGHLPHPARPPIINGAHKEKF